MPTARRVCEHGIVGAGAPFRAAKSKAFRLAAANQCAAYGATLFHQSPKLPCIFAHCWRSSAALRAKLRAGNTPPLCFAFNIVLTSCRRKFEACFKSALLMVISSHLITVNALLSIYNRSNTEKFDRLLRDVLPWAATLL